MVLRGEIADDTMRDLSNALLDAFAERDKEKKNKPNPEK